MGQPRRRVPHRGQQRLRRRPRGVGGARDGEDRAVDGRARRSRAPRRPGWRCGSGEVGQQRDGQPAGDEREADRRVVGAVADVGVEAAVLAAACAGSSPPSPSRRARSSTASPASSASGTASRWRRAARVAGGQDEVDRVAQQLVALEAGRQPPRLVLPLVAEHEVDVAERERGQRLLGLGLDELAAQARRVARERLHRREREPQRDRLEAGDAPAARDRARRRGEVGLGERRALEQAPRRARPARAPGRSGARRGRRARAACTPASRSSAASCCETADGVNCSASATAAIVPRSCSSRSRRRRRRSSIV